jgi:hypothetical protein
VIEIIGKKVHSNHECSKSSRPLSLSSYISDVGLLRRELRNRTGKRKDTNWHLSLNFKKKGILILHEKIAMHIGSCTVPVAQYAMFTMLLFSWRNGETSTSITDYNFFILRNYISFFPLKHNKRCMKDVSFESLENLHLFYFVLFSQTFIIIFYSTF